MADTLIASRSLSEFSVPLLPECQLVAKTVDLVADLLFGLSLQHRKK